VRLSDEAFSTTPSKWLSQSPGYGCQNRHDKISRGWTMDPLSITATCIGLASTITRTSLVVIGFVKDVRAARSDLDTISRELLSVKTVLELLADDVNESTNHSIPQTLQKQIVGIVTNCTSVVVDIEETLKKHDGGKLNKAAKWIVSGKNDVAKLQSSLEAHKSALEIALDMVNL
jgi:hypothetical protein